jgi:hypothetical protein
MFGFPHFARLLTLLVLCDATTTVSASLCPSFSSSASNPVACVLFNFTVATGRAPIRVSFDSFASPYVLIVSYQTSPALSYFLNGTLYKQLVAPQLYPFASASAATQDSSGFVYFTNFNSLYVQMFSPFPSYAFYAVLRAGSAYSTLEGAVHTVTQGTYLYLARAGVGLSLYKTNVTGPSSVSSSPGVLVGTASATVNQVEVDPTTGAIAVLGGSRNTLTVYRPYQRQSVRHVDVYSQQQRALSAHQRCIPHYHCQRALRHLRQHSYYTDIAHES